MLLPGSQLRGSVLIDSGWSPSMPISNGHAGLKTLPFEQFLSLGTPGIFSQVIFVAWGWPMRL